MPKVKVPRKSTTVDMTAMCDVAFLLLTFFMLTSNFVAKEPITVAVPASVSEIKIAESDIITILVDAQGKVFVGLDAQPDRKELLKKLGETYQINFTDKEVNEFSKIGMSGVPIHQMKGFLALPSEQRDSKEAAIGIPADSLNNEFEQWIRNAKSINRDFKIAIKADKQTPYKVVKSVMNTLQGMKENRYNLITSLAEDPTANFATKK